MSKSVATESKEGHESRKNSGKRGAEDGGNENEEGILVVPPAESLTISTVVSTAPATTDQFMHTPEFRRHFVEYVPGDTLMTLRLATKVWKAAADAFIDEGFRSGAMMVHDGKDMAWFSNTSEKATRRTLVTRVVFLLNITKIGTRECSYAANLVVVDIPEGVKSIGEDAFCYCNNLTSVTFPTSLKLIGESAFEQYSSLENVDLLHTNLQELGWHVFNMCSELISIKISDSLQTLGRFIFMRCSKLVPSSIVTDYGNDTTSEVVAYLRSIQQQP